MTEYKVSYTITHKVTAENEENAFRKSRSFVYQKIKHDSGNSMLELECDRLDRDVVEVTEVED